jgi:hypothetical protein
LILLFGSFAVFALVNFFFMPIMREQKDFLRAACCGDLWAKARFTGGFSPGLSGFCLLYAARPASLRPPEGFFPSLRCQAGLLDIVKLYQTRGARLVIVVVLLLRRWGLRSTGLYIVSCITAKAPPAAMTMSS